jgi:hypothetical protein
MQFASGLFALSFELEQLLNTLEIKTNMKIFAAALLFVFSVHPLHISVTEINFDEKEKQLEIMMRVFVDDLEQTMRKRLQQPELDITDIKGGQTLDQMMKAYIDGRFKISLDSKPQVVNYLGHEREGDAFIFYIEVAKVKKWKTIQVQNQLLTEMFDDQSNLVHVTVREVVHSMRLTRDNPVDKLTFDIQ